MRQATPCSRFGSRLTSTAGRQLIVVRPRRPTRGTRSYHSRPVSLPPCCQGSWGGSGAGPHTGCASGVEVNPRQTTRKESITLLSTHKAERKRGPPPPTQTPQPPLGVVPVLGPYV